MDKTNARQMDRPVSHNIIQLKVTSIEGHFKCIKTESNKITNTGKSFIASGFKVYAVRKCVEDITQW